MAWYHLHTKLIHRSGAKNPSTAGNKVLFTSLCTCLLNILISNSCRRLGGNASRSISAPCLHQNEPGSLILEILCLSRKRMFEPQYTPFNYWDFYLMLLCSCTYCFTQVFRDLVPPPKKKNWFAVFLGEEHAGFVTWLSPPLLCLDYLCWDAECSLQLQDGSQMHRKLLSTAVLCHSTGHGTGSYSWIQDQLLGWHWTRPLNLSVIHPSSLKHW